ncbi:hypothetical protein RJ641_002552 [Dillenia turbinata]|uniref:GIR1-like zinc ribbon domain-containing protein n=1 Tax=Dillenia turbinata TaxID=194707 RepID=A0AAN8VC67_9MAGN
MTPPNMATNTEPLERSLLEKCTIKEKSEDAAVDLGGVGDSATSDSPENNLLLSQKTVELNSEIPLPYFWEQCLDLKTGETYFINWKTGMKLNEDPRLMRPDQLVDDFDYSEGEDSSCDSEESSPESSPASGQQLCSLLDYDECSSNNKGSVLVVKGCKRCFMYYMISKQATQCPKCSGQLLHFDAPNNAQSP